MSNLAAKSIQKCKGRSFGLKLPSHLLVGTGYIPCPESGGGAKPGQLSARHGGFGNQQYSGLPEGILGVLFLCFIAIEIF